MSACSETHVPQVTVAQSSGLATSFLYRTPVCVKAFEILDEYCHRINDHALSLSLWGAASAGILVARANKTSGTREREREREKAIATSHAVGQPLHEPGLSNSAHYAKS